MCAAEILSAYKGARAYGAFPRQRKEKIELTAVRDGLLWVDNRSGGGKRDFDKGYYSYRQRYFCSEEGGCWWYLVDRYSAHWRQQAEKAVRYAERQGMPYYFAGNGFCYARAAGTPSALRKWYGAAAIPFHFPQDPGSEKAASGGKGVTRAANESDTRTLAFLERVARADAVALVRESVHL